MIRIKANVPLFIRDTCKSNAFPQHAFHSTHTDTEGNNLSIDWHGAIASKKLRWLIADTYHTNVHVHA